MICASRHKQNQSKEEKKRKPKKNAATGTAKSGMTGGSGRDVNSGTVTGNNKNQGGGGLEDANCQAKICNQSPTYQSILKNYCQADFVIKMKFKSVKKRSLRGRKVRSNSVYKTWKTGGDFRKLRKPRLQLESDHQCCSQWLQTHSKKQKFLVMGKNSGNSLVPTYIVPWSRDKEMKRARRMFKQIDCSTLREAESSRTTKSDSSTQFSHSHRKKSLRQRNRRENFRENERNVNKQRHQQQKQRKRKYNAKH